MYSQSDVYVLSSLASGPTLGLLPTPSTDLSPLAPRARQCDLDKIKIPQSTHLTQPLIIHSSQDHSPALLPISHLELPLPRPQASYKHGPQSR